MEMNSGVIEVKFDTMQKELNNIHTELEKINNSVESLKGSIVEIQTTRKSFFQDPRMWLPLVALALSVASSAGWISESTSKKGNEYLESYIKILEMQSQKMLEFPKATDLTGSLRVTPKPGP